MAWRKAKIEDEKSTSEMVDEVTRKTVRGIMA